MYVYVSFLSSKSILACVCVCAIPLLHEHCVIPLLHERAIHLLQEQSCVCVSHECVCVFHRAFLHVCVPFLSGVLSGYFLSFLEHSYVSECVCVFSSKTIPVCVCVCHSSPP